MKSSLEKIEKKGTLHDRAMAWVAVNVKGQINHTSPPTIAKQFLGSHYPDVVVRDLYAYAGKTEYHEVEVLPLPPGRILEYKNAKVNKLMPNNGKRKLWIVVPRGTREAFDSIVIIEEADDKFKRIR